MAIEAKYDFIRRVESGLSSEITANDLTRVMAVISDILEGYNMQSVQVETDNSDLLDCFVAAMQVQGLSQKTIDNYVYIIKRMMKHVQVSTRRISVYHLRSFIAHEKERGLSDCTLENYRGIFSAYFKWLHKEQLIDRNPAENLGRIKIAKKQRRICSEVEFEKLMRACNDKRNKALMAFLSSTGCRVSEAVGLNREQINFEKLQCTVHGKGKKERVVYLDEVTGLLLREYLAERTDDNPALFLSKKRNRLAVGSVRNALNQIAKKAGVEHIHPHKFRRTLATNLARRGMPIQDVARILGHEKIDTTMRYVNQNDDDIRAEYRRYA